MRVNTAILMFNTYKTYLAIALYMLIFVCIGLLFDIIVINAPTLGEGFYTFLTLQQIPIVTLIMGFIALSMIYYSITNFKKILLGDERYKEINPDFVLNSEESALYELVDTLRKRAGLPFRPTLYIIEADYLNAFASGWNGENSIVALTTAIIDKLSRDELAAVIAHELSHIKHGDIKLTMTVGILSNVLLLAVNFLVYAFMGNRRSEGANKARMILLILQFVLPLITFVLQMFLSRSREYMADTGAAEIMGENRSMIAALQKISARHASPNSSESQNKSRRALYIFDPSELFSTHPSVENRIKSLKGEGSYV